MIAMTGIISCERILEQEVALGATHYVGHPLVGLLLMCFVCPIESSTVRTTCRTNITKGMLQVQDGGKTHPILGAQPLDQARILPVFHVCTVVLRCTVGTTELTRGPKTVQVVRNKKLELVRPQWKTSLLQTPAPPFCTAQ